jgi:hypothetical protein
LSVADFNSDGHEDLFMAQNFFAVDAETSRYDAGRGLLLLGNGNAEFRCVDALESGIALYGEQRGVATADYDRDGRPDIAVGQSNGRVGLFRNQSTTRGVRVQLTGRADNPDALGTVVRLKAAGQLGPARAIHAGSGLWSQESPVQVMSATSSPTHVWVRWPGGAISEAPIGQGQTHIQISPSPRDRN